MDWQGALLARVRAAAGVTALVGAKSYWEVAPQSVALPYVVLYDQTPGRPQTLKGWDLEVSRVQIDVHSLSYSEKQSIMEAVLAAIVPGNTSNGHIFQRAEVDRGPWDAKPVEDGPVTVLTKQADLLIYHKPT